MGTIELHACWKENTWKKQAQMGGYGSGVKGDIVCYSTAFFRLPVLGFIDLQLQLAQCATVRVSKRVGSCLFTVTQEDYGF
jgi:hypothetical protein